MEIFLTYENKTTTINKSLTEIRNDLKRIFRVFGRNEINVKNVHCARVHIDDMETQIFDV